MNPTRKALIVLLVLPLFFGMAVEDEEAHSSSALGFAGKVVNFLVLFGGLIYFLRKPLGEFLEKRGREIGVVIREAKKDRREMEEQVQQSAERLAALEGEILKIRADAREEGEKRKEQILQSASKEAAKIREWSRQEIDMFFQAKVRELKIRAAERATALARQSIEDQMTPQRQVHLLDRSIVKLEEIHEK